MKKEFYVYIMASRKNGTIYVGVTLNLIKRVYEHKNSFVKSFTQQYDVKSLIYYEMLEDIESAIFREKQLKSWKRAWKVELIEKDNSNWGFV